MLRSIFGPRRRESAQSIWTGDPARVETGDDLADAVAKNRVALATLQKRHFHVMKKAHAQSVEARRLVSDGDRVGALLCLRRRKLMLKDLNQMSNFCFGLESQITALEATQAQMMAVEALEQAAAIQHSINQKTNIEMVDRMLDRLQENQETKDEICQALGHAHSIDDSDDLIRELNEIEALELDSRLLLTPMEIPMQATVNAHPIQQYAAEFPDHGQGLAQVPVISEAAADSWMKSSNVDTSGSHFSPLPGGRRSWTSKGRHSVHQYGGSFQVLQGCIDSSANCAQDEPSCYTHQTLAQPKYCSRDRKSSCYWMVPQRQGTHSEEERLEALLGIEPSM